MKKYYLITIFAISILAYLQVNYIYLIYQEYNNQCSTEILNLIYLSIDNEQRYRYDIRNRKIPSNEFTDSYEPIESMNPNRRDSILKLYPLPPQPPIYDIEQLRKDGIIRNSADVTEQRNHDNLIKEGFLLNTNILDSIFSSKISFIFSHKFILYNNHGKVLSESNTDIKKYQEKTKPFIIGINARQQLILYYNIPLSTFIIQSIWSLIASFLLIIIATTTLIIQATIICRKQKRLDYINQNINATIHDLKSPLSGVVMTLDLAKSKTQSEDMKRIFGINQSNIKHLISTIDSLLTIARKSNGEIIIKKRIIDKDSLSIIMTSIISDLASLYEGKSHIFNLENNLKQNEYINADPLCINSIIRNLLDNALKYSNDGVEIELRVESSENWINFTITDNGWGIPRKYLKKLFKEYFRIPRDNDIQRGYGIGLTQVKYLVERHSGTIRIESEERIYTTVYISLPKDVNNG